MALVQEEVASRVPGLGQTGGLLLKERGWARQHAQSWKEMVQERLRRLEEQELGRGQGGELGLEKRVQTVMWSCAGGGGGLERLAGVLGGGQRGRRGWGLEQIAAHICGEEPCKGPS